MSQVRVLAIDDDPALRWSLWRMLSRAGFEVDVASEGGEGMAKIKTAQPDVVICNVNMRGVDGFGVLESMRSDAATLNLPFVFMTSRFELETIRRGLWLGADDVLSKPVNGHELVAAILRALDKRRRISELVLESALCPQEHLDEIYRRKPGWDEPDVPASTGAMMMNGPTGRLEERTVLCTDIRGFTRISERLPAAEIAELLTRYMHEVCKPIAQEGGQVVELLGDGVMAVFGRDAPDNVCAHASAALRAAHGITEAAENFRIWLNSRFNAAKLPRFNIGVGIHTGQVLTLHMVVNGVVNTTVVGDTVNVACRLEARTSDLAWPIVASLYTIQSAGREFVAGETREVQLAYRDKPIAVGRVIRNATHARHKPLHRPLSSGHRAVLKMNARSTAKAAKYVLDQKLQEIGTKIGNGIANCSDELTIRGYRVLAKLSEAGMSTVYIAYQESHRRKAVLKVVKARRDDDENLWKRFFQECVILSGIDHKHVVRIYDQGFGDEMAYIAMEYLAGGTLREAIQRGISRRQALSLLSQAARGLAEIHRRGIVHRDIKPTNLILRSEGVLVLTDFGVAKHLNRACNTARGEILGTPYYLSPEQAEGGTITPATDLYSLGVVFYEMLTGRWPFQGETVSEILSQHMIAPVPQLPAELSEYQRLIDGMLAKRPEERFPDSATVLSEIDRVRTTGAVSGNRR